MDTINVGLTPDDNTGDPLRVAFIKCNNNFAELLGLYAGGAGITISETFTDIGGSGKQCVLAMRYTGIDGSGNDTWQLEVTTV